MLILPGPIRRGGGAPGPNRRRGSIPAFTGKGAQWDLNPKNLSKLTSDFSSL